MFVHDKLIGNREKNRITFMHINQVLIINYTQFLIKKPQIVSDKHTLSRPISNEFLLDRLVHIVRVLDG